MPYLEHDGVTRELAAGDTLVGSGSEVDWRLETINLAPRHFSVHVDAAGSAVLTPYRLREVEINGSVATGPHPLAHGDEIIAGAGIFAYLQALEPQPAEVPAHPAAAAYLVDIAGMLAYPLTDDAVRIGRDPVNHVPIRDPSVSRFHAEVMVAPDGAGFVFRSMGASGSTVNGALVGSSPRPLAEGDLLRIGGTALRFSTQPPPPKVRVVTKADVPAGPRSHQPTQAQRAIEPATLRAHEPLTIPREIGGTTWRRPWIAAAVTGVVLLFLVALLLRALQS